MIRGIFNKVKMPKVDNESGPGPEHCNTDGPETLNLSDLNLQKLKLSEEDALALSYLTPGLSRRIQKQLFASLPPSEARKISRTMSMRDGGSTANNASSTTRRSVDRISSTLPRKFSYERPISVQSDINLNKFSYNGKKNGRTLLPTNVQDVVSPLAERSSSFGNKADYVLYDDRRSKYSRSSSLREPIDFKTKASSYIHSPNSSISEIPSIHDDESEYLSKVENTCLNKYMHPSTIFEKSPKEIKPIRKVSRFLRPDFYDPPKEEKEHIVVKEKKEREMETQKVLKEIRDKRIKNRLHMQRDRSLSREKSIEKVAKKKVITDNGNQLIQCKDLVKALTNESEIHKETESLLQDVSDNIKNIESNVLSKAQNQVETNIVDNNNIKNMNEITKKERISKLIRPKSYPTENGSNSNNLDPSKTDFGKTSKKKISTSTAKESNNKQEKYEKSEKQTAKSNLLHSIEKKIEKFRSNSEEKCEKKSGVGTVIKRFREQSVPHNTDHITESTLIKRAVSVDDFSNVKQKSLQPSKKGVTKILSLFKKYEDKEKKDEKELQLKTVTGPTVTLPNIVESNIPTLTSKYISPESNANQNKNERPKTLYLDKNCKYIGNDKSRICKLSMNNCQRKNGENIEDSANNNMKDVSNRMNNNSEKKDFSTMNNPDVNLNQILSTTNEGINLLSPCDETLSCDSWSMCSDYHHTQDLVSPLSPNGNIYNSGDENESVIDRIRRKSFYTRFNEKKKTRKTQIGNYRDLDLYKDYPQKNVSGYHAPSSDSSSSYRKNSGFLSSESEFESRPYVRSKSVTNEYTIPHRYQTYNPRRNNITSLYSENNTDVTTNGLYKKFCYNPNPTRIGNIRTNKSPNRDLQNLSHTHHRTTSEYSPLENQKITEHPI